jgi:uncharacterized protein YkwD
VRLFSTVIAIIAFAVPAAALGSGQTTGTTTRSSALVAAVVREVNELRVERGLRPLAISGELKRAADTHSQDLLEAGVFTHDSPDGTPFSERLQRYYPQRSRVWTVGENLLMSGPVEPSSADVIAAWMKSPGHRANLLNPRWRELGVGARFSSAPGGDYGGRPTWVVTLDLGARR